MTLRSFTGISMIALPLMFNISFAMLAKLFDYPDVLRQPTIEVLSRFTRGGTRLVMVWWVFMLSAVLFAPMSVAVASVVEGQQSWLATLSVVFGVLAAMVQFLGLARWPFVVPYLAREAATAGKERKEMIDLLFQVLNRFFGVGIGEHLGYAFTGLWSLALGALIITNESFPAALGICGMVIGCVLIICSFEFVGANERNGWALAGRVTPFAYVLWSLWLVVVGVMMLKMTSPVSM